MQLVKKLAELDEELESLDLRLIKADICEDIEERRILWEKADLLRHDPGKLADLIIKEL